MFKKANVPSDIVVLYFDLGTHKDGRELGFMINQILPGLCTSFQAYGFEASRPCAAEAAGHFSRNSNVKIVHAAICDKPPKSGVIQLYVDGIKGLGNSLFREATGQVEHVPAIRLSQWITQKNLNLSEHICLIRMNIEGAEFDVARDLVESGFAVFMDGFFGMWDDVSKICPDRDREFRKFLKQSKIYPFPFNGRDMRFKLRTTCIEYEVHTAVHAGLERLRSW